VAGLRLGGGAPGPAVLSPSSPPPSSPPRPGPLTSLDVPLSSLASPPREAWKGPCAVCGRSLTASTHFSQAVAALTGVQGVHEFVPRALAAPSADADKESR
jgi:hypothetical protein